MSASIDTGDSSLDQVLEDEAELKSRMADMLDHRGWTAAVAFLLPWLDDDARSGATWRFMRLVGDDDSEVSDQDAISLAQLIAVHAEQADDADSFGRDVVELLVESIDGDTTARILSAMNRNRRTKK